MKRTAAPANLSGLKVITQGSQSMGWLEFTISNDSGVQFGDIQIQRMLDERMSDENRAIAKEIAKAIGTTQSKIWMVKSVGVRREFGGQGYGQALYLLAIDKLGKYFTTEQWLTNDIFEATSPDAIRVWNALGKYVKKVKMGKAKGYHWIAVQGKKTMKTMKKTPKTIKYAGTIYKKLPNSIIHNGYRYTLKTADDYRQPKSLAKSALEYMPKIELDRNHVLSVIRMVENGLAGKRFLDPRVQFNPIRYRQDSLVHALYNFHYDIAANKWRLNYYLAKKYKTLGKATKKELEILERQRDKFEEARSSVKSALDSLQPKLLAYAKANEYYKEPIESMLKRFYTSKPESAVKGRY